MFKDGTYNVAVGFPKGVEFTDIGGLTPSFHARTRAADLNIGRIPTSFSPKRAKVVEITVEQGTVTKILAREELDTHRDLCYVFLTGSRLIKTVWINTKCDKHYTLDRTKFAMPN